MAEWIWAYWRTTIPKRTPERRLAHPSLLPSPLSYSSPHPTANYAPGAGGKTTRPRATEGVVHRGVERAALEMRHEPGPAAMRGDGTEITGIATEGDLGCERNGVQARGDGIEYGATDSGVRRDDGDAKAVVKPRAGLGDAPEVADGEIRATRAGFRDTPKARGAETDGESEGQTVIGAIKGLSGLATVGQAPTKGRIGPGTECLVAEGEGARRGFGAFDEGLGEAAEDGSAGDAVADDLHRQEVGVGAAEEAEESGDLAGGAGVEDATAGAKRGAGLAEGVAQVALDVLGAAHGRQAGLVLGGGVDGGDVVASGTPLDVMKTSSHTAKALVAFKRAHDKILKK